LKILIDELPQKGYLMSNTFLEGDRLYAQVLTITPFYTHSIKTERSGEGSPMAPEFPKHYLY